MLPDIPSLLRSLPEHVQPLTPTTLAGYFALPEHHFHQRSPKRTIVSTRVI